MALKSQPREMSLAESKIYASSRNECLPFLFSILSFKNKTEVIKTQKENERLLIMAYGIAHSKGSSFEKTCGARL